MQASIEYLVSQLLYDYDCVIIPDFGGFLASNVSARIAEKKQLIAPPSREVSFNALLRSNDGLLASRLAAASEIPYSSALVKITARVDYWNESLSQNRKIELPHVGVLFRDRENNLQFVPSSDVNYQRDSFGLPVLSMINTGKGGFDAEVEKQLKKITSLKPAFRKRAGSRWSLVNGLLVAGSILWLSANIYLVFPGQSNKATLNPFDTLKNSVSISNHSGTRTQPYTQPAVRNLDTVYVKTTEPIVPDHPVNDAGMLYPNTSYYIIAGAFLNDSNAQNKVKQLRENGFANARIVETENRLQLVCYDGYDTKAAAYAALSELRSANNEGWVYSR